MKITNKLKVWHLMLLSIFALLGVVVFVWMERGDFSTREVSLYIEGSSQMENGKSEKFAIIVENNSSEELENLNLSLDIPESIKILVGKEDLEQGFSNVPPGEKKSIEFSLISSSIDVRETIGAQVDYSPKGISARFVVLVSHEIIIGSFDISTTLDLTEKIYVGQEIEGKISIIANSDIEISPLYLKLNMPEGFNLKYKSTDFYYDTIWQLGSLNDGQNIKREFRGTLPPDPGDFVFSVELGIMEGVRFISFNEAESSVQISKSPLILEHKLISPAGGEVKAGSRIEMEISYLNKSEFLLKDTVIKTSLPARLIDFSSLYTDGIFDDEKNTVEWNADNTSTLRFVDIDEDGKVYISFNVVQDLVSKSATDTNKSIFIETTMESSVLEDKVLKATEATNIRISTNLNMQQDVYRGGGQFIQEGPHPPQVDTLSTYTVRWAITNTINQVKSVKIEAALPSYAVWMGEMSSATGEVRYMSSTNTVVWIPGTVRAGLGYLYPKEQIEFKIGVEPSAFEAKGLNTILVSQTKLTGTDAFTGLFLEQNIGKMTVSN